MRGIILVMVHGLKFRYLLVIVPVGFLTPLIPYSRYIMNTWDMVISLFWVQAIVVTQFVNFLEVLCVRPRDVVQVI